MTSYNIRDKSGVILHKAPFNIKIKSMRKLIEINTKPHKGIITTIVYKL